ncbi:MAG: zinc dependent phospholipase C family protein [Tissierellales bacterium]
MKILELYYGKAFRSVLKAVNPFKKTVIKTEAKVHQFINIHALNILKENGHYVEYNGFKKHINTLNKGAVWADQDFKSINHFYNPIIKKGLYGHGNALKLTQKYYKIALDSFIENNIEKSMFYLGASIHIIQDLTIPQHVNIRLLDNHRQYENYVKLAYNKVREFGTLEKPIQFDRIEDFVRFNTKVALQIFKQFKKIKDDDLRFYKTTRCSLPLSQRTTAGCLIMFYRKANNMGSFSKDV